MKAMNYVYEKLQEIDNFVTQEFEKYVDDLEKTDDIETYVKNFKGLLNYANGELKYFIEDNEDILFESDKKIINKLIEDYNKIINESDKELLQYANHGYYEISPFNAIEYSVKDNKKSEKNNLPVIKLVEDDDSFKDIYNKLLKIYNDETINILGLDTQSIANFNKLIKNDLPKNNKESSLDEVVNNIYKDLSKENYKDSDLPFSKRMVKIVSGFDNFTPLEKATEIFNNLLYSIGYMYNLNKLFKFKSTSSVINIVRTLIEFANDAFERLEMYYMSYMDRRDTSFLDMRQILLELLNYTDEDIFNMIGGE